MNNKYLELDEKSTHNEFLKAYSQFVKNKEKYFQLQLVCHNTYGKVLTHLFIDINRDIVYENMLHKKLCLANEFNSIKICKSMSKYFEEMYKKLKDTMHQYCIDLKG